MVTKVTTFNKWHEYWFRGVTNVGYKWLQKGTKWLHMKLHR